MSLVTTQNLFLRACGFESRPFQKGVGLVIGEIDATTHIGILVLSG